MSECARCVRTCDFTVLVFSYPTSSLGFCSVNDDSSSFQKLLFLPSTMFFFSHSKGGMTLTLFPFLLNFFFAFFGFSSTFFLPNLKATASQAAFQMKRKHLFSWLLSANVLSIFFFSKLRHFGES